MSLRCCFFFFFQLIGFSLKSWARKKGLDIHTMNEFYTSLLIDELDMGWYLSTSCNTDNDSLTTNITDNLGEYHKVIDGGTIF